MKRRDVSLTVALCTSFAVHVFLLRGMAERYVRSLRHIFLAGEDRAKSDGESQAQALMLPAPVEPRSLLGEETDKPGNATDSTPGETELQAKNIAQTVQPMLGRDAPGENGSDSPAQPPAARLTPPMPPALPGKSAIVENPTKSPPDQAESEDNATSIRPNVAHTVGPQPATEPSDNTSPPAKQPIQIASANDVPRDVTEPHDSAPRRPPENTSAASPAANQPAKNAAAPGKPVPQGESDSDAFTPIGSVEFRGGAMDAQLGRPHKLTRPRIDLGGLVDAVSLSNIRIVLRLTIDQTGKVSNVEIAEPSGSSNIDQAVRVAAYEWWFKPKTKKDAAGIETPLESETFKFSISFR